MNKIIIINNKIYVIISNKNIISFNNYNEYNKWLNTI